MKDAAPLIDEPVSIVDYDPAWQAAAAEEMAALGKLLSSYDARIEHVGSTAVEGMSAKPVLDLIVGLKDAEDVESAVDALKCAEWVDLGEAGVPGRRYLRRRGSRDANLHLVRRASRHWQAALVLRDFLWTHPAERHAYSEAKRQACAGGRNSLLAYSDAKRRYVTELIERAYMWASEDEFRDNR